MLRLFVLLFLMAAAVPRAADACSCSEPGPPCQAFWTADAVFSGTVLSITTTPPPLRPQSAPRNAPPPPPPPFPAADTRVTIRADRVWRGGVSGDVDVYTSDAGASCGFDFKEGETYLVYARMVGAQLRTSRCSRTAPIGDARDDQAYFAELQRPGTGGRIYGKITVPEYATAANHKVVIGNESGQWSALTDAEGAFEFANRAPGRYGIRLDAPDTYRVTASAPLVDLRDTRACAVVHFSVRAAGYVGLTVLDAHGKPAVRTTLELIEAESLGAPRPTARTARTHADGSVAWADVPPGSYVIGLNVTQVVDPVRPQPVLFYPGVADAAAAHIFHVAAGERVELDTLRLPAAPERRQVTGVVTRADGSPIRGADVFLRSDARFTRGRAVGKPARTDAEGRFTLTGLAGHRYVVEVMLGIEGEDRRPFGRSAPFELTDRTPPLRIGPAK
ncbi:MAG TPA: carboxypeptidase regulatory-like domain-containing protein [Vicinamibacterales bacterium]|nr:carboxypeptidase regulatory-like domain-containing protein [Vicinamibacterales bacterium]